MIYKQNIKNMVKKIWFTRFFIGTLRRNEIRRRQIRRKIVKKYLNRPNRLADSWVKQNTEPSNFYYPLTEMNRQDLISTIAVVTGRPIVELRSFLHELLEDEKLQNHLRNYLHSRKETKDSLIAYGRREGWYIFIRALKPKFVVETGVHHGVGASLIAAALLKNRGEGHDGTYLGTEINKSAGALFFQEYASAGEIQFGDSISTLANLTTKIDIFINDSDHSSDYEALEYSTIKDILSQNSLILGDNSHATGCLRAFAEQNNRPFLFFKEVPDEHWYPGGGIGISPARIPLK